MKCNNCGNEMAPDSKFCANCGAPYKKPKKEPGRAGDVLTTLFGGIIAIALIVFFVFQHFGLYSFSINLSGAEVWQYEKKIVTPIEVQAGNEDVVVGNLEKYDVAVYVPSQAFDSETTVILSNPKKNPQIDTKSFAPLGSPISLDARGEQKRLNRPVRVTIAVDSLENTRDGSFYIADFNERNKWDYIVPDEINVEKRTVTFTTYHLSTFGVVNLGREKNVEDLVNRKAIERWARTNMSDVALQARYDVVNEILRYFMLDGNASAAELLRNKVAEECPESVLSPFLTGKDPSRFAQKVVNSIGANIPKILTPDELEKTLEEVCQQSWISTSAPDAPALLADGNLAEATVEIIDGISTEFIVPRVENIWVDLADRKVNIWNRTEVEKAYQVYREGSDKARPLWGYVAKAGNFDELWDQMRGVTSEINDEAIGSYCRIAGKNPDELTPEEKILITQETKQALRKQFEQRASHEADIEKIKTENTAMVNLLNEKSLLKLGNANPAFNNQDDLETLMERIYETVDKVKKDTGRFDIIYQVRNADNYGEAKLDNMIYMSDIADLIYVLYDKGEGAYMQKLADLQLSPQTNVAEETIAETVAEETTAAETTAAETTAAETTAQETVAEETTAQEQKSMPLNGKWGSSGFVFEISGPNGVFYTLTGMWQTFADAGFIKLGDLKLKNIAKIGDNKWKCQELYWFTMDGKPSAVGWSGDATITMSDDGKSITIKSTGTHPDTGETFNSESTYLRQ
jgi:hypothetical protein